METVIGVLVLIFGGFLMFFIPARFKKKIITMTDYEKEQAELKNKILTKTPEQKKENRKWFKGFFGAVLFCFCLCSCGKSVFVIPEIPQEPFLVFEEKEDGFLFKDSEVSKLRVYIESCKLWRKKCVEMLEGLK